jgi:hypothetical protein
MIRLCFLIALLVAGPASAPGQEWFPVGARWEVNQLIFFPPGNTSFNIRVVGEDTLDGRLMRRLEGGCACTPWHDYSHVYEENDRVYAYDPKGNSYELLYDFTLEPGDTLTYTLPDDGPTYFRLDSVTLADFNGTPIRVQHLSWLEGWMFIGFQIYEFVGGYTCLYPQVQYCDPGSGAVICYEDPNHGIFNVSGPCLSSTTPNRSESHTFRIYPNPPISRVDITSDTPLNGIRLVESTTGRMTTFPLSGIMTESILVDHMPRGVYAVQVMFTDGTVSVGRLVLQ